MADKEIINVVSISQVSKEFKGQVTVKKLMKLDNGDEIPVTEKNGAYKYVTSAGTYEITRNSYGSIATAKLIKKSSEKEEYPVPQESDFNKQTKAQPSVTQYQTAIRQPSEFEKNKQKEISLMCYTGIAKDILIALKKDVSPESVFNYAVDLYNRHNDFFHPVDKVLAAIPGSEVVEPKSAEGESDVPF